MAQRRLHRHLLAEPLEVRQLMAVDSLQIRPDNFDSNGFLVQFALESGKSSIQPSVGQTFAGTTIQKKLTDDGWFSVIVRPGTELRTAMAAYRLRNDVQLVTPDFKLGLQTAANDTSYASQWGLSNNGASGGRPGADIRAEQAWQYGTSSNVIVGVLDTGIDSSHPDLTTNLWRNSREIGGNGIDDDRNGYVDDIQGWDFANNDANPTDDNGHGTHVAGTIGASGNNGIGVSGVAWQVLLMPLKFMDASGSGSLSDAMEGINYARSMGAKIINASWGGGGFSSALQSAIAQFKNAGGIFVAAAGNESSNNVTTPAYPANYTGVISVGASTRSDTLASFSNYGTNVDIVAPGASILSTLPNNRYGLLSGTSMAAPHVSGALALLWGQNTTLSASAITNALLNNTNDVLRGSTSQYGRMNVGKAAAALRGSPANPTTPITPVVTPTPNPQRRIYSTTSIPVLADATSRGRTTTNIPINIDDDISIEDLNVAINVNHTWVGDLSIRLIGPDGTTVNLIQRRGGSGDNLQLVVDDQASTSVSTIAATTTIAGTYRGEQALSAFRGRSAKGQWTLQVIDSARGDIGVLRSAQLQIVPRATATRANSGPNQSTPLTSGFDFSSWQAALQRERESAAQSTLRANFNRIIDRIFADW